ASERSMRSIRAEATPSSFPPASWPQPVGPNRQSEIVSQGTRRQREAIISVNLLCSPDIGSHRNRRAVRHHNEQRGRGAESRTGDAMLAGPTDIFVVSVRAPFGHLLVPLFPFLAPFSQQCFADAHVAEKLLAAVGAKTREEVGVAELPGKLGRLL